MALLHKLKPVKIHSKYLMVLPKEVRRLLKLKVGDKLEVNVRHHSVIELKPVRHAKLEALEAAFGALHLKKKVDIVKAVEESIVQLAKE